MDFDYIKIFVTTFLAVLGWLIAHHFTEQRTLAVKRRDVSLTHLIDAYRILTNDISQRELNNNHHKKLENLISDIQLFGSTEQVHLARQLADEVASERSFELNPLIYNLRDDLRTQLQLAPVDGNVKWLRFEAEPKPTDCVDEKEN